MKSYDVGGVLNVMYKARINLCIKNHLQTGFYGKVSHDQIFYSRVLLQDFNQPTENVFHISSSLIPEMDKWYFSKSLNNLCQFFLNKISTEIPQILEYVEDEEPTKVEATLIEVHKKGCQFIIESVWDFGYDVFLLKKMENLSDLRQFNSDEITEIAEWIDLEMTLSQEDSYKAKQHKKGTRLKPN